MIYAFVESIKYVGHMIPVALLRIFLGYFYFNQALSTYHRGFLQHAYLAEDVRNFLPLSTAPEWYKNALETVLIPNWQVFATVYLAIQFIIGFSYIVGYMVRPVSLLAILYCGFISASIGSQLYLVQISFLVVLHLMLGWVGAGRCLGFDYFFYKRRRGIWW